MNNLTLNFYTINNDFALTINNNSEIARQRYNELLLCFWNYNGSYIKSQPLLEMNKNIRNKYNTIIDKYKKKEPKLNKLQKNLNSIEEGQYFCLITKLELDNDEIIFISNLVKVWNGYSDDKERAKNFENLMKTYKDLLGDFQERYEIYPFDCSIPKKIGEPKKEKRICRFCGNSMNSRKQVSFKLKAHAISEALGNKNLILHEECDSCNSKFGDEIEKDFICYLDVYRVFYKVRGKKGIPTLKFDNGTIIKHLEKNEIPKNDLIKEDLIVVVSKDIKHDKEQNVLSVPLKSFQELKEVNIYKTLCKYALSVINKKELKYFVKTIEWLQINEEDKPLAKVAFLIENKMYTEDPFLTLYLRKNNNIKVPHLVGEFKFKSLIFVFIVPFSSADKLDFTNKEDYNLFFKTFKHYDNIKSWEFKNFSSIKSKQVEFNIMNKMINNE